MAYPNLTGNTFSFLSDTKIMGLLTMDDILDKIEYSIQGRWEKHVDLRELKLQLLENGKLTLKTEKSRNSSMVVRRAYDSGFWDHEFYPHIGCKGYLKRRKREIPV